jgi:hypothetical protein
MVSAWDVYWVMQLDAIGTTAFVVALLGLLAGGVGSLIHYGASTGENDFDKATARATKVFRGVFFVGVVALMTCAFLPSSKTAAAMILVPALTSEQVIEPVGAEARELYALAKQALTNIAQPKPEPEAKK